MARIAHIRTWTYITHRGDWVEDSAEWQERARGIEDRLSDALHESITQRFVDRRSAFLVRQLASEGELIAAVSKSGEVLVEGAYVGRIEGLWFVPDSVDGVETRMLIAAASRVLRGEIAARTRLLAADADEAFAIGADGELRWRGAVVGRMVSGEKLLAPKAEPLAGDFLEGGLREKVRLRLQEFLRNDVERRLAPLFAAQQLSLSGVGRGLVYQLVDALGCLPANNVAGQVAALEPAERKALSRLGVRFGTESVYIEPLLRADTMRFQALLWGVWGG
jgi:ATP-dependent RNA helicase SUPV3L1/SUV3